MKVSEDYIRRDTEAHEEYTKLCARDLKNSTALAFTAIFYTILYALELYLRYSQ